MPNGTFCVFNVVIEKNLRRGIMGKASDPYISRDPRQKATTVSLRKTHYPHCSKLFGCRNPFERNFTTELKLI